MDFIVDDSVGFIVSRTDAKMKNYLHQKFKSLDITTEQWGLLARLRVETGISQKELSDKSCKDQPNITRILDKLEEKGLIRREANPDDRRGFLVFLSESGARLRKKAVPIVQASLSQALKGFTEEETTLLKTLLNRIFDNLEVKAGTR